MRSLVLSRIGELRLESKETPAPAADEVVIRIVATGICGSDVHGYTGENGRRVPGQVMGHESVGRIAAVGADVDPSTLSPGQVVTFNPVVIPAADATEFAGREQHHPDRRVVGVDPTRDASFADEVVVPARNVVVLNENMPIEYGALIEPLAVAVHAVRRLGPAPGARVLVVGGGPIGQSVVLALGLAGVDDITVSEIDSARRSLCEKLGAIVIDPTTGPLSDAMLAGGRLADATIDAVGITATLRGALEATVFGGRVCLLGMGAPTLELDAFRVSTEERDIVGSFTYSAQDFSDAAAYIAAGDPRIGLLISREVSPEEADDTFAALAAGDGTPGKVLVRFDR